METIITAIGTILGTAAMFIYRDWRDGKSLFKKNGNGKVDHLVNYYNHDLTGKLDRLLEMEEREHERADKQSQINTEILWHLKELRENGIDCKNK